MRRSEPITIERRSDWVVVGWPGDVDRANVITVEQRTLGTMLNSDAGLVLDLTQTEYLDSAAMGAIVGINRALHERQQVFRLLMPEKSLLEKALEVAGIPTIIPVCRSLDAALAH